MTSNHSYPSATSNTAEKFFTNTDFLLEMIRIRSHIKPETRLCLSILDIDQLSRLLRQNKNLKLLLSAREQEIFSDFHHIRRKKQWLGGRLAVKNAVGHWLEMSGETHARKYSTMSVTPLISGRPSLALPQGCPQVPPGISISHSGHFAVGLVSSRTHCGIDIQEITPRVINVKERFSSPEEIRIIQADACINDVVEQHVLLWCTKEAIKKGILHDQPSLFSGITLLGCKQYHDKILLMTTVKNNPRHFEVRALRFGNYYLAYTNGGTDHAGAA